MKNDSPHPKPSDSTGGPHAVVELRDVSVQFGENAILSDINLSISRGRTVAVIGESGCGKTVLLKTVIGLIRATRGQVILDGRELAKLSENELAKQRIRFGFVFQQAALFDSLSIGENVAFPLRQHTAMRDRDIRDKVVNLLAEVGLPDSVVNKKPVELSGGMRKRVGLARALATDPEMILYDEPTTGLDPIMSDVINELILKVSERGGVASVVVTHDMNSAKKVADRVVMLYPRTRLGVDESQIVFDGTPKQLNECAEPRVRQFVRGEAGERLMELRKGMASNR